METTSFLLFIGGIGGTEVVLIVLAILLFFGAKRIPELARGLGRGIREFKDASKEIKDDFEKSVEAKSAEAKTFEAKSAEAKTLEANPVEANPAEAKLNRQTIEP
jgi:sec-independent protein translocase protein TatA